MEKKNLKKTFHTGQKLNEKMKFHMCVYIFT